MRDFDRYAYCTAQVPLYRQHDRTVQANIQLHNLSMHKSLFYMHTAYSSNVLYMYIIHHTCTYNMYMYTNEPRKLLYQISDFSKNNKYSSLSRIFFMHTETTTMVRMSGKYNNVPTSNRHRA